MPERIIESVYYWEQFRLNRQLTLTIALALKTASMDPRSQTVYFFGCSTPGRTQISGHLIPAVVRWPMTLTCSRRNHTWPNDVSSFIITESWRWINEKHVSNCWHVENGNLTYRIDFAKAWKVGDSFFKTIQLFETATNVHLIRQSVNLRVKTNQHAVHRTKLRDQEQTSKRFDPIRIAFNDEFNWNQRLHNKYCK